MCNMMFGSGLNEHANDNSEELAQFGHRSGLQEQRLYVPLKQILGHIP